MKRKFAFVILFISVFSIFAIDDEKLKENINKSRHLTELMVDEEYIRRQRALAEERRLREEAESELYDGVLDIKYHLEPYYNLVGKFLRVELFAKTGTFNIYCRPLGGRETPLLSTTDYFSSTSFLTNIDGKVTHLVKSNRVIKELRRYEGGAQLVYLLDNDVRLIVDFSLVTSREDLADDIVQVRLYAINLGNKSHTVDLRGIFDTVCGENSSVHFTTDRYTKIRNETRFLRDKITRERAVISSNGEVSFQFVLDGQKVTPIESVTMANIDELGRLEWESGIRKGRGFSNARSYDDSGVMIDWNAFPIAPDEKAELTFFIAAAENGESPRGLAYADGLLPLPPDSENPQDSSDSNKGIVQNPDKRTDVEFIVPPIKDYQLNPDYIQGLIDRIDALQSSKNVNQKELRKLNAELDAILEKLRRK